MSLDAKRTHLMPDQTAHVARAIFPKGDPVIRLFDDLQMVVADHDFADLFPTRGQPAAAPVRLADATLLPCVEGLTDRQTAGAVRTRRQRDQITIDKRYLHADGGVRWGVLTLSRLDAGEGSGFVGVVQDVTERKRFPVDVLKIDKAFVDGIARDESDAAIARAVVALGQALGLRTVAEGVEDAAQCAALRALGCGYGQGYLFARPLPPDAFAALLRVPQPAGAALG